MKLVLPEPPGPPAVVIGPDDPLWPRLSPQCVAEIEALEQAQRASMAYYLQHPELFVVD